MPYRPNRVSAGYPYPVFDFRDGSVDHQPHVITNAELNGAGLLQKVSRTREVVLKRPTPTPTGHAQFCGEKSTGVAHTYYGFGVPISSGLKPHYLEIDAVLNLTGSKDAVYYATPVLGYTASTPALNAVVSLSAYFPLGLTDSTQGKQGGVFTCCKTIIMDSASPIMILSWQIMCSVASPAYTYDGRLSWRRYEEDLDVFDPNR